MDSNVNPKRDPYDGLESLNGLSTELASEFVDWTPEESNPAPQPPDRRKVDDPRGISRVEEAYIKAVIQNPGAASSAYPKILKISPRSAQAIRTRLVESGYLKEHRVNTGKRGRSAIILEPLEAGLEAVGHLGRTAQGGTE